MDQSTRQRGKADGRVRLVRLASGAKPILTRDNNRSFEGDERVDLEAAEVSHWLTKGVCRVCGLRRDCPKRARLSAARAWASISKRLDVPGVAVNLLTVTTGKPSWQLAERVDQLRKGLRRMLQARSIDGVSAIEWVPAKQGPPTRSGQWAFAGTGWHVHAHVAFLGSNPWPAPHGWQALRSEAKASGLGSTANIKPARARGGLFAARYCLKYISKSCLSPERQSDLKGRRLWQGHGSVAAWKGSPGWLRTVDELSRARREIRNGDAK